MNCDEFNSLLSVFLEDDLGADEAAAFRVHMANCGDCARVFADFSSIISICSTEPSSEIVPPNSQALWCRINNLIESELKAEEPPPPTPAPSRFWRLSFAQLAASVLGIAMISSLLTVVAIRNYMQPAGTDFTTRAAASQTPFEKFLSKIGLMETPAEARERRIREQHAAIDYWNSRVQVRRGQWDRTTREAFDRNLSVIEESVNDYTTILQQDPEDELSGEMLDTVLDEKMALLRDFADL